MCLYMYTWTSKRPFHSIFFNPFSLFYKENNIISSSMSIGNRLYYFLLLMISDGKLSFITKSTFGYRNWPNTLRKTSYNDQLDQLNASSHLNFGQGRFYILIIFNLCETLLNAPVHFLIIILDNTIIYNTL